jgi:hypothetical protein
MIKNIRDNCRIYGLIIVKIAKTSLVFKLCQMPFLKHLTMLLPTCNLGIQLVKIMCGEK